MPDSTATNVTARTVERCRHGSPIGWPWGRCGTCKPAADVASMAVGARDPEPEERPDLGPLLPWRGV